MSYPDSDLSATTLAIMAVVITASLAAWLILVFRAAREPRDTRARADTADQTSAGARNDHRPDNQAAM